MQTVETLSEFYKKIDNLYLIKNNNLNNATYTKVESNFNSSANYPRHRWFSYKEGFSPILVKKAFEEHGVSEGSVVCDPFCGAGTTLLVAKENGIRSLGFEVNPFAAFISRTKLDDYSEEDLEAFLEMVEELSSLKIYADIEPPDNEYLCRLFSSEMLAAQLSIREFFKTHDNSKAKNLLYFSWLCTLEKCSDYRKAGNGLKRKAKPPRFEEGRSLQYALQLVLEKAEIITEDLKNEFADIESDVFTVSSTNMQDYVEKESLDLVLFSPPYANCFDYTKIYYLELWFGEFVQTRDDQKSIRMSSIRSHCHATWPDRYESFSLPDLNDEILPLIKQQKLWTNRIPDMLNGYFADMEQVLLQIHDCLKSGGSCDIVVSNSAYAGIVVPTDVLLAEIAERIGFEVVEIAVERLIITSSQQYKKTEHLKNYLRESTVKLRKKD